MLKTVTLARSDYPGASQPGDKEGVLLIGPSGGVMGGPYRDEDAATFVKNRFAPEAVLERCKIRTPSALRQ
jgi:hypothetical protein